MRNIALVGRCENTRRDAPFHEPGWEIWSLAIDRLPRYDRVFEIHEYWRDIDYFRGEAGRAEHCAWLAGQSVPVYMRRVEPEIPSSVAYPLEEVTWLTGRASRGGVYLESSIAFMLALAIHEGVSRIGIWGVDLDTDGEYAFQRPNLEYLIGLARGRGIKVTVPPRSALLTHAAGIPYGTLGWMNPAVPKLNSGNAHHGDFALRRAESRIGPLAEPLGS